MCQLLHGVALVQFSIYWGLKKLVILCAVSYGFTSCNIIEQEFSSKCKKLPYGHLCTKESMGWYCIVSVNWFRPVDIFLLSPLIHIWTLVSNLRIHLGLITLYRHSACICIMLCLLSEEWLTCGLSGLERMLSSIQLIKLLLTLYQSVQ